MRTLEEIEQAAWEATDAAYDHRTKEGNLWRRATGLYYELGRREMWDEIQAYCDHVGIYGMSEENLETWRRRRVKP